MEKSLDRILAGQNGVITYDKETETGISFLVQIRFLSKQKMERMFIRPSQQNCRPTLRHVWMFSKKSKRKVC